MFAAFRSRVHINMFITVSWLAPQRSWTFRCDITKYENTWKSYRDEGVVRNYKVMCLNVVILFMILYKWCRVPSNVVNSVNIFKYHSSIESSPRCVRCKNNNNTYINKTVKEVQFYWGQTDVVFIFFFSIIWLIKLEIRKYSEIDSTHIKTKFLRIRTDQIIRIAVFGVNTSREFVWNVQIY